MRPVYPYLIKSFLICLFFTWAFQASYAQTWEVYDESFTLQKRLIFEDIQLLGPSVRVGKSKDKMYLLSSDFEKSIELEGDEVYQYLSPWILVKGPEGIGAYHHYGQKVVDLIYDEIQGYINGLIVRKGTTFSYYHPRKNTLVELGTFDHAHFSSKGLVIAEKEGKFYLPLERETGDFEFESIEDHRGNYLLAKGPKGYGLINSDGRFVLDPVIDTLIHTDGDFYFGKDQEQFMLVEGHPIKANLRYNSFYEITHSDGLLLEYIHGKLRRILRDGGILLDTVGMTKVEKVSPMHYLVKFKNDKLGLYGANGWLVRPAENLQYILPAADGRYPAADLEGKWGFVDSIGNWLIASEYEDLAPFENGLAPFKKGAKWGLLDHTGTVATQAEWEDIHQLANGLKLGKIAETYVVFDSNRDSSQVGELDQVNQLQNGDLLTVRGGLSGVLSKDSSWKVPMDFDSITMEQNDFYVVQKNGKVGMMNSKGETSLPIDYVDIILDSHQKLILAKSAYEPVIVNDEEDLKSKNGKKRKKKSDEIPD